MHLFNKTYAIKILNKNSLILTYQFESISQSYSNSTFENDEG